MYPFVGTFYDLAGQGIPIITPVDQKAAVKAIMTDTRLNKSLYDELGVDVNELKKAVSAEITRGLATGLTYEDMARNLSFKTNAPLARANTIIRTESHRIQQASAEDARQVSKSKGADVVKQWDATLDGDTRPTHRQLDGQIRETDKPFEANGKEAMYPGDFGDPAEDCNCRCVALTRARWALDEDELETLKERAEFFGLDKTKSFDDFKKKYLKATETLKNQGFGGIMKSGEMFKKSADARKDFKAISQERFDSLTIEARKKGATILRGTADVERHLDEQNAAASTIGDILLFRKDACISEVLEETRHYMQNLEKMNNDKDARLRTILNEIDAKTYVIENAEKYHVPRNEVEHTKNQLDSYKRELEQYKKGGV